MNPTDACPVFRSGRRMLTKDRKGSWGAQGFPKDPRRFFHSKTTFELDWKLPIGPPQLKLVTRCYQQYQGVTGHQAPFQHTLPRLKLSASVCVGTCEIIRVVMPITGCIILGRGKALPARLCWGCGDVY